MEIMDMEMWAEGMHDGGWRSSDRRLFQAYYEWDTETAKRAAKLLMKIERREKAKR